MKNVLIRMAIVAALFTGAIHAANNIRFVPDHIKGHCLTQHFNYGADMETCIAGQLAKAGV
jgi:hypothetical protein